MRKDKPIIVALDVFTRKEAERLVDILIEYVRVFKVGHQLFLREGLNIVHMIQDKGGEVFLDLKFHDIPSVISNAVEAAFNEKIYMLTMHSLGGKAMLKQATDRIAALHKERKNRKPILLGVTVLTSLNDKRFKEMGFSLSVKQQVLRLAKLAEECGLDGVVCSGEEINLIRGAVKKDFLIIVPGVRIEEISSDDQSRIISPEDAVKAGADYLVMGRSITESNDPKEKIALVLEKLDKI
ncbi:MAG: orotidine-5'-phosphate decarboxylase [Candidatus Ratteibacteria bacterium]|nr:orotidine-5'-phosphate decarboxylase [Candidatus Ratteibacteria bacterium]